MDKLAKPKDDYATFQHWVNCFLPIGDSFANNPGPKFAEVLLAAHPVAMQFIEHFKPTADVKRRVELEYVQAVFDTARDMVEIWQEEPK